MLTVTPATGISVTKTVDADGNVVFDNITVEDAGEYVFTVKEAKGDAEGITYDETIYTVTVIATDNGDGTLNLEYAYADENGAVEKIVFENTYEKLTPEPQPDPILEPTPEPQPEPTPEPESPKTGDNTNLSAWLAVVFISGALVFVTGRKLKRLSK